MQGSEKWLRFIESEADRFRGYAGGIRRRIGTAVVSLAVLIWALLELVRNVSPTTDDLAIAVYVFGIVGVVATLVLLLTFVFLSRSIIWKKMTDWVRVDVEFIPKAEREGGTGELKSLSVLVGVYAVAILVSWKADALTALIAVVLVLYAIGIGSRSNAAMKALSARGQKISIKDMRLVMKVLFAFAAFVILAISAGLIGPLLNRAPELLHIRTIEISFNMLGITALVYYILSSLAEIPRAAYMASELRKLRMFLLSGMPEEEAESKLVELYGEFRWKILKTAKIVPPSEVV